MSRVDLFTVIHKGIRSLLFELAREAARVDLTSTHAVDGLVARVERTLGFLDEHARLEDMHVFTALRALGGELADELNAEHRSLEVVQLEVERAADALALAQLAGREEAGAHLARLINHLVAVQLIHMNREETEVNATLWAGLPDSELGAIRTRLKNTLSPERFDEWMQIVGPALNPVEHRLVIG
ncbi:MAG TPA: hemerythrin domain-containing protein [Kofleriaceae bacterium]|nr:hemerythrin domain-containing protein [Kofleriaceae bacterium]